MSRLQRLPVQCGYLHTYMPTHVPDQWPIFFLIYIIDVNLPVTHFWFIRVKASHLLMLQDTVSVLRHMCTPRQLSHNLHGENILLFTFYHHAGDFPRPQACHVWVKHWVSGPHSSTECVHEGETGTREIIWIPVLFPCWGNKANKKSLSAPTFTFHGLLLLSIHVTVVNLWRKLTHCIYNIQYNVTSWVPLLQSDHCCPA